MPDPHKNFAYSTVATAPSPASSGTSLVVASGEGTRFPAVPFNATIWPASSTPTPSNAEVVRVTARSTDTLTITRAQESSSARTVVVGDQIAATITALTITGAEAGNPLFASTWYYYATPNQAGGVVNTTLTRNRTYSPGPIPLNLGTLVRVGIEINGTGDAGSVIRLGLFADSSGVPGSLVADFGTIAADTTTGVKEITISQAVSDAKYWFTATQQGGTVSPTFKGYTASITNYWIPVDTVAPSGNPPMGVRDGNNWTGALGGSFGTPTSENSVMPRIFFRY